MPQLVFRSKGRRVRKSLSVDEKIIALKIQLGMTRQQAINDLRWISIKSQVKFA